MVIAIVVVNNDLNVIILLGNISSALWTIYFWIYCIVASCQSSVICGCQRTDEWHTVDHATVQIILRHLVLDCKVQRLIRLNRIRVDKRTQAEVIKRVWFGVLPRCKVNMRLIVIYRNGSV